MADVSPTLQMRKLSLRINSQAEITQLVRGELGARVKTNVFRVCIPSNTVLAFPHPNHMTTRMLYLSPIRRLIPIPTPPPGACLRAVVGNATVTICSAQIAQRHLGLFLACIKSGEG